MNNNQNLVNTLRLGQHELHRLLERFDQSQPSTSDPNREFVRWAFRVGAVELTVQHTTGSKVTLPVATRNISRGGISILHAAFIHVDTPCQIALKVPGGKTQRIQGKIVRCAHIEGRVHEVGIAFDEQISTKDLLGLDPLNEAYSLERVEPDHLHGSVLVVTPTDLDRDLILMFLEETQLALSTADNIENALARAEKGCELIIADYHLGEETGVQLISALREAGSDMPVIIMTSDKSESALDAIREAKASGILSKPVTKDRALQALAEFLHADGDGGPLYTTLKPTDTAYPLMGKFLMDVPRMALNLEKALKEDDKQACVAICRTLCGTAAPLGFPAISEIAIQVNKKLSAGNLKDASTDIRTLIVTCRRLKSKPAAA